MLTTLDEIVTIRCTQVAATAYTATKVRFIKYLDDGFQNETKTLFTLTVSDSQVTFNYKGSKEFRYEDEAVMKAIESKTPRLTSTR
ncbi:hypothetical protein PsorP6_011590 [Peronosclerospora sorghi]|uniref:Uncharacterized protein n=1 Tax=Peronosclerospora sorghi TaxID=230839 RepID=A0ACC0WJB7_9STRA|nr:hypothetical protein PsorP6_011590 [Peronosclerospora sorghi]